MNKKIKIAIIFIALILIPVGVYFGIYKFKKNKTNLSSQNFQNILQLHNVDNFNPLKAISEIDNFIKESEINTKISDKEKSYAKVLLGYDYLFFIDPIKGIEILKQVAENQIYGNYYRAFALGMIGDKYEFHPDKNFSKEYVFTGDLFGQFIKENPNDIDLAYKKLYEFSNELFPHAVNFYRIALWHSDELLRNKNLSFVQKEEYVLKAKEKIGEGDKLYNITLGRQSSRGLAWQLKARSLANLYFYDNKNITKYQINDYFKKSLSILTTEKIDGQMRFLTPYVKFYYAVFLAKAEGEKAINEIQNLLEPLYDPTVRNHPISDFLRLTKDTADNQHRKDIENLSEINPRFKFLIEQL